MPTTEQMQAVMTGTESNRIEALRRLLAYPVKQLDPEGSRFWYLRPGADDLEAADTLPIAVGFYPEFNEATQQEIVKFLTSKEQPSGIYEHYISRANPENKPVMYILLPEQERTGRVALILPTEGGLRQRQIQTFAWNDQQLLGRLSRLEQGRLPVAIKALNLIPLVEWVFYEAAKTAQELAKELAKVTRRMEQAIPQVYNAEDEDGYLRKLFVSFKRELLPTLKLTSTKEKDYSFADIYAQTIAYALFTARVFSYVKDERQGQDKETYFNREDAWQYLPETNPFLRRLFEDVSQRKAEELGEELIDAISELFSILRAAKMDAILLDFRQKMNREDIVIRFYEDFLAAYKPQMQKLRGVYYTPEPVVSYMVRSVDELLKDKFNKPLGLADPEVMILDPACGTGTFLLWICQLIYQRFQELPDALTEGLADKSWSGYVKERLLPRIFGFELLMAPYAIAHLKLGLFLEETGYQFDGGKRLGVYLTNSLENAVRKSETLFEEFIAEEADQATAIKREKPIMVVVGNPPYSISSANKSEFIEGLMERYKKAVRGERNISPLSDDYIKFICLAHHQIEKTGHGIIGLITNHSYINGLIHRGMREEFLNTFNHIFVMDLHGNSLLKETTPNRIIDQNVFDIQQGVAVFFAVKGSFIVQEDQKEVKNFFYYDFWGSRQTKYNVLSTSSINSISWSELKPSQPNFFFAPKSFEFNEEYFSFWSIQNISCIHAAGIKTRRDNLYVDNNRSQLVQRFIDIAQNSDIERLKEVYKIKETEYWTLSKAKKYIKQNEIETRINKYFYRPFDIRWIYYHPEIIERGDGRWNLMRHMISEENLALVVCRQQKELGFQHAFMTKSLSDGNAISINSREYNYYFPLYIYPDPNNPQELEEPVRQNFSQDFLNAITSKLGYTPTPEAIFYYIYAIFHSPTYRNRYAEFLKIDFPRVPLTSDDKLFRQLATYGEELVALHLMKSPKLDNLITQFVDTGGNCLVDAGHPKFINQNQVVINKKGDKFTGIAENIWNFYVGGYQVCQKWLKDRKGRTLSDEDIQHYQRIVVALKETIELMAQIDEAIPGFPIE